MSGRENSRREGWRNHAREAQALGEAKRYQRLMLRQAVKVTALSNGMRNPSALRVGQEITIPTSLKRTLAAH